MGSRTLRDAWGIPHLRAGSLEELAHAQGGNAAVDRTWQLELGRWRAEGASAARLGPSGLEWDQLARRTRLPDTARRCFDAMDDVDRDWFAAYADGVNSALPQAVLRSSEHRQLGIAAPDGSWEPWHPVGVFLVQHALFGSFPHKLWRRHAALALGEAAWLTGEDPALTGSNAWALTGSRTASGAPLLAGDPHRVIELPGVYQQVHLGCPGVDVVGLAFPGVPGVAHYGHTGGVAWGVTNAMADQQDLFREVLRRRGPEVTARGPDGWAPVVRVVETVEIRGGAPVEVEVLETERGPVVVRDLATTADGDEECLSLRTPARVDGVLGLGALRRLLLARSVDDVQAALAGWVDPVNSVVAADTAGTVRRFTAGRVPSRRTPGPVPPDAWDPQAAWDGDEALPWSDVIDVHVAANDRRTGDNDGLATVFAAPHRARRIRAVLGDRTGLTVDDMAALHTDTSPGGWPVLRDLLARTDTDADGAVAALRDRLLGWDARMDADSHDAAVFASWRGALVAHLVRQPVLAALHDPTGYPQLFSLWTNVAERVGGALDRIAAGDGPPGLDVRAASAAALVSVASSPPAEPWGATHVLHPAHPLEWVEGMRVPVLPRIPLSGDTECVLATTSAPGVGDACWRGPVARWVWDLADRRRSRWVVPFGASGHDGHPHLADQLPLWAAGDLVPVVTDRDLLTAADVWASR